MHVYGDVLTRIDTRAFRAGLVAGLDELARLPGDLRRHEHLTRLFIDTASLATELFDRAMPVADDVPGAGVMGPLMALARALDLSFRTGFRLTGDLTPARVALAGLPVSGEMTLKPPEGYSFYALYPEAVAEAARASGLGQDTQVIGIRSIGTGLAAMLSAALGAPPPVTVRPRGHPFSRTVSLTPQLAGLFLRATGAIAVVDEGPGLSGSSFGGVIDRLEALGITRDRIHLFPSHPGTPGAAASEGHLTRWAKMPRHLTGVDDLLIGSGRLADWLAPVIGPLTRPLEDLGGGRWAPPEEPGLDPVPLWERRKWRATTASGRYLVKFSGLGREGEEKVDLARRLFAGQFVPEPIDFVHGFIVSRWVEAPRLTRVSVPRPVLLEGLARYLAARAALPLPMAEGASLEALARFARANAAEALGEAAASRLDGLFDTLPRLQSRVRPVWVDARLHAAEWLVTDEGLIKTDALDHARTHTPLGPQDIAYDVAGASLEHGLTMNETQDLLTRLHRAGTTVDPDLVMAYRPIYLGLELGAYAMGLGPESAPARRLADRLKTLIKIG